MRPNWRLSSLRVLSQQLRSARATWRQRWHTAQQQWRPRLEAAQQWVAAHRRPLVSSALLMLLLVALIAYDRPTWPPLPLRQPQTGDGPGVTAPPLDGLGTPDAVWPRPGGPANVAPEQPGADPSDGSVATVGTVPGTTPSSAGTRPPLTAAGETMVPPVDGEVLTAFGFRVSEAHGDFKFHTGIDLAAPAGTEVRAAYSGVVTAAGFDPVWGWHVRMDLGDEREAIYGNLDVVHVEVGAAVVQGTVIGTVGRSAPAEQDGTAHLHFELRVAGEAVPPGL